MAWISQYFSEKETSVSDSCEGPKFCVRVAQLDFFLDIKQKNKETLW